MAGFSTRPRSVDPSRGLGVLLRAWLERSAGSPRGAGPQTRAGERSGETACAREVLTQPAPRAPLLEAYTASAFNLARQAEFVDPFEADACPVGLTRLVDEVVRELAPVARDAGLLVLHEAQARCAEVESADPVRLRRVLSHLLLRALAREPSPGHVRVMVALAGHEVQVRILSRVSEATLAMHGGSRHHELTVSGRLIQAMGGSLTPEPRRAGYLPLCIALPAVRGRRLQRAA